MSACYEEVSIIQRAVKQAGRMAHIFSAASLSQNCRVIQKTSVTIGREIISDLLKAWGIAPEDRIDFRIQSHCYKNPRQSTANTLVPTAERFTVHTMGL